MCNLRRSASSVYGTDMKENLWGLDWTEGMVHSLHSVCALYVFSQSPGKMRYSLQYDIESREKLSAPPKILVI